MNYESDIDNNGKDSLGLDNSIYWISPAGDTLYNSTAYAERHYFETHPHNPGFWDVTIGGKIYHAAHHLLDYVKVWDLPSDMIVPKFPQ